MILFWYQLDVLSRIMETCRLHEKPEEKPFHCWIGPRLIIPIRNPEDIKHHNGNFWHDATGRTEIADSMCCKEKVRAELTGVLEEESVTENKLSVLKYLSMVIKETLRLFPICPVMLRKLTGDVRLESCMLPEGSSVAMIPFLTHRDPDYWTDPDHFNPERFTPENSVGRHPYAYIPFSGGLRGCVGKQYGMLHLKMIVAHVIRKYRLNSSTSLNELKLKSDIVLRSVNGYRISISRV